MNRVPNEWRMVLVVCGLAVILAGVSFFGGRASGAVVITHTRVVKQTLQAQYGKPDQSVAGKQISASLDGLTCDVFQAKQVIVCHR